MSCVAISAIELIAKRFKEAMAKEGYEGCAIIQWDSKHADFSINVCGLKKVESCQKI